MPNDSDLLFPLAEDPERGLRVLVLKLLATFLSVALFVLIFLVVPWWLSFPITTLTSIGFAAIILAAATSPIVQLLRRYNVPAPVTIASIIFLALAILGMVGFTVVPLMSTQVQTLISQLSNLLQSQVPQLWLSVKPFLLRMDPQLAQDIDGLLGQSIKTAVGYVSYVGVFANVIANFISSIALLGGYGIIAVLMAYYFASEPELLEWPAKKFLPLRAARINSVIAEVHNKIGRWARCQLGLSIFFGCGFGLWLSVGELFLGGQWNAATIGFLGGFVDIIPFGSSVAIAVSMLTQISQHNWWGLIWVAIGAFVIPEIEWHILAPRTMGHALRIHPLFILLFVFGGFLWKGMLGSLGAIPTLIVLNAVVSALYPTNAVIVQPTIAMKQHRFFKWRNLRSSTSKPCPECSSS